MPSPYKFISSVPAPGQIVEIRRRRWIVRECIESKLRLDASPPQHLVTAESIDEDGMGEQIQVIWELEPGAKVREHVGLPDVTGKFDTFEETEAFLNAVRWGAASNTERLSLQAPFRSGITIEDYQLDPLIRAIDMPRVNLLIADDVGLGKTIEAGLVIQEMLLRHRARTVFIVCPASLQLKWQAEMQEKFGLEFRIVNSEFVRQVRRERGRLANPWKSFPRLITSMDWIKQGEGLRLLKEALPSNITYPRPYDILLIDEAHNIAPAGSGAFIRASDRTKVIRLMAPHFSHHLFLSATPHNGYTSSFTSLLELLDDQRFARHMNIKDDALQVALRSVFVRRMKTDITDKNGNPVFAKRCNDKLLIDYTPEEEEIYQVFEEFKNLRLEKSGNKRNSIGTQFLFSILKKRFFSSPAAFAVTLQKYCESLTRTTPTRLTDASEKTLRKVILRTVDDFEHEEDAEEAATEAIQTANESEELLSPRESELLETLTRWAEAHRFNTNSKSDAIIQWLNENLRPNGVWNNKRVILFTEYRDTHSWLWEILAANDFGGERLGILHGSLTPNEREAVKTAFQSPSDGPMGTPMRILLATDAASEGIDLQNYCNNIIHIEIPWTPNVLEQRNGRIDRHGQREKEVHIWFPVGKGTHEIKIDKDAPSSIYGDYEYLMRIYLREENIRDDIVTVSEVLSQQIANQMLYHKTGSESEAEKHRKKRAASIIIHEQDIRDRIKNLHERLLRSRDDFHLSPDRIRNAVQIALRLAEQPLLSPIDLPGVPKNAAFDVPDSLSGSWSDALIGLNHPNNHSIKRAITFDSDILQEHREDLVLAHLNHRLVALSLRLLREEVWALSDTKKIQRVSVRTIPVNLVKNQVVAIVYSRLLIVGGDHTRLHEELTYSAGILQQTNYKRIETLSEIQTLLKAAKPCASVPKKTSDILQSRFSHNRDSIMASCNARSAARKRDLQSTIKRKLEREKEDILSILSDLEDTIKRELSSDPDSEQLKILNEVEAAQLELDKDALRARLERIPFERDHEIALIEKHYTDYTLHTFPVSVLFLIPDTPQWL